MLAHHPKTGKPIRIMRSEASIWRNQKTLIHLEDQDPTVSWDRWDTLTIGLQKMKQWMSLGKRIDYVVLTENTEENRDWILSVDASRHRMIFISRVLISSIGEVKFRNLRIQNIICIEEIVRMYPYMGPQWDTTKNDLIVLIGCLLRYMRISGLKVETVRLKGLRDQGFEVKLLPDTTKPPQLWFITQFYNSFVSTRNKELKKCIRENMKCSLIDKIVFLSEKDETDEYPDDLTNKIKQVIVNKRLTYKIVIQWIKENVPDDVICVFANADIYLDSETWRDIWTTDLTDKFIALLRYEITEDGSEPKLFGPRNDSQDTWAIYSNSVKSRDWDYKALDIMFGKAGCDNAITVEMLKRKFLVVNPALSLKTFHVHTSQIRNYDPAEVVDRPAFMYVDPTGIHDMEPILNLDSYTDTNKKIELAKFERRLHSIQPRVLDTYCKMMEREERYLWSPKDANVFKETALAFYKYKNVFQTPQGLVYGYNHLLIGRTEASKTAWSESRLSSVTPTYAAERCLIVPWKKAEVNTSEGYLLYYVSKIMMMRERFGPGDFWAKDKESVKDLQLFNWSSDEVPVIPHSETTQIWCAEAIQYPWLEKQEVHKEEIDALRKALKQGWISEPSSSKKKRWVVMVDEKHITSEMVQKWEETFTEFEWSVMYEGRTSMDRKIDMLLGSTGFLSVGGKDSVKRWGISWVLPKGATYVEVQNEMDPCGEAAHVSGAAGLIHSLIIVPRASDSATQNLISKHFSKYLGAGLSIKEVSNLPILRLPRSDLTGYYAHAGDSFREMAKLWAEKGYVQIVEDPTAVQVWLGSVGDVLLYDRPNTTWLFTAPQQEQTWKKALFGNPKPVETGGPVSAWFFWPRRPRLVEQVVASGSVTKSWDERAKSLVFYGKIENRVQEKRRKEFDWSTVCDDFCMVQGETTPYSLTQEEYLLKLTDAKFGLCLAGFGNKCHREVECMAMGCVPIVAKNVDMESYAVPPIEGLHYVRVETPEDALIKMKSISSEKWTEMSEACRKWWRETASVEGSWALTQKLKQL